MRKTLFILVGLALAGCATTSKIDTSVKQVRDYTVAACKYLPTVATVAAILDKGGVLSTPFSVGQQICNAVTNLPMAEGPTKRQAVVNGVVVRGKFVN